MKHTFIFATNNKHKLEEIQQIVGDKLSILSLQDMNFREDIPENEPTIEGNALYKARFIYNRFGKDCFADDTGLEVVALNGEPGVLSARYAGEEKNYQSNNELLLKNLNPFPNKSARFKTVIACVLEGREYVFEGIIEGTIVNEPKGKNGFGYDPIFQPSGYQQTFAELSEEVKNTISHRARAMESLFMFLQQNHII
ncbi:MAG: non-canonical purine NTP diphosphatase [Paludibacteraceae bacterium]|nr:non-canonical purine NTP diphosphatase [Paludibacteraceae bacterium]NLK92053.1 non-canonical purine NTP diphosphatase [Bacteroidales bacterium]MBP6435869.1 non-canonical purine NTP diphosphatase [Paludibacteraceae bacterium]MBP7218804.1 non-canonical purine NTP diphosphatase [Paludibacteraceae bacterium]MBP8627439.1 non-canonical purine NTP diphosphatase [Paludibacteraceae bacterium]